MVRTVELPLWLFVLILLFAVVTFASHFLFPSVRWFLRRRLERAVARLNKRLARPIEPFKLARRQDMIQRLIYDPEVTAAIVAHAREEGVREDVAFETARRYAREIVPSFSAFAYFGFGIRAARWLANLLYDVRTGPQNDQVLKGLSEDTTVVFIMNHRSNMDYVLVTYLAARASALSYAVGEWARIWPLSRLIKSMGAYFIRRKSRGALYRKVLARYVQMATAGGVTQAIFPEGGLSLNGKLMPPKLGLLAYVFEAAQACGRDVAFVPVAINYDRVLEDRVLLAAHKRGDRRFGAKISVLTRFILRTGWQKLRGRFSNFGQAGVVFGAPVRLSSFTHPVALDDLANNLMQRIEAQMPALAVPVVAHLLRVHGPMDANALVALYDQVADGRPLAVPAQQAVPQALAHLQARHLIRENGGTFSAAEAEADILEFYANAFPDVAASAKS